MLFVTRFVMSKTTYHTAIGATTDSHTTMVSCRSVGYIAPGDLVFDFYEYDLYTDDPTVVTVASDPNLFMNIDNIDSDLTDQANSVTDMLKDLNRGFVGVAVTGNNYNPALPADSQTHVRITVAVSGVVTTHVKPWMSMFAPGDYLSLFHTFKRDDEIWLNRPDQWVAPCAVRATRRTAIRFIQRDNDGDENNTTVIRVELCKQNIATLPAWEDPFWDVTNDSGILATIGTIIPPQLWAGAAALMGLGGSAPAPADDSVTIEGVTFAAPPQAAPAATSAAPSSGTLEVDGYDIPTLGSFGGGPDPKPIKVPPVDGEVPGSGLPSTSTKKKKRRVMHKPDVVN